MIWVYTEGVLNLPCISNLIPSFSCPLCLLVLLDCYVVYTLPWWWSQIGFGLSSWSKVSVVHLQLYCLEILRKLRKLVLPLQILLLLNPLPLITPTILLWPLVVGPVKKAFFDKSIIYQFTCTIVETVILEHSWKLLNAQCSNHPLT